MIGQRIRRLFGPLEGPVARLYRAVFFDLDGLAQGRPGLDRRQGDPGGRLRRGTLDGAVRPGVPRGTDHRNRRDAERRPTVPRRPVAGHLPPVDARRLRRPARRLIPTSSSSDVLHHVPWEDHGTFLSTCGVAPSSGGRFVLKDWERRPNAIHALAYASDRWVTGDRCRTRRRRNSGRRSRAPRAPGRRQGVGPSRLGPTISRSSSGRAHGDSPTPRSKDPHSRLIRPRSGSGSSG